MKFQVHSALATCLLTSGWPVLAQTAVDLTRQGRIESGAQLPAQCSQGQLFLKSGELSGPTLYICSQPNGWSASSNFVAGAGIAIAGASIAADDAIVPVYSAGAGTPTQDCLAGRDFYVDVTAA
ncbi:MAG TPA: hypothetical protein VE999_04955, partial [Gemmataceae bacterium]|nr:hypothetical protein [Gemmataceae bacterium]